MVRGRKFAYDMEVVDQLAKRLVGAPINGASEVALAKHLLATGVVKYKPKVEAVASWKDGDPIDVGDLISERSYNGSIGATVWRVVDVDRVNPQRITIRSLTSSQTRRAHINRYMVKVFIL